MRMLMCNEAIDKQVDGSTNICSSRINDAWKMAAEIIKLENDLINHRLTSLLAVNAFLFAGIFALMTFLKDIDPEEKRHVYFAGLVLIVIVFLGVFSSYLIGKGVRAASRQINNCAKWMEDFKGDNVGGQCDSFPAIVGVKSSFVAGLLEFIFVMLADLKDIVFMVSCRCSAYTRCKDSVSDCHYKFFDNNSTVIGCIEDSYSCQSKRDVNNVSCLSAGAIYFPQLLFIVWIVVGASCVYFFHDGFSMVSSKKSNSFNVTIAKVNEDLSEIVLKVSK